MPQGSTRISRTLSNLTIEYKNAQYIANDVLGNMPVKQESDLYWIYNVDLILPQTARANGSRSNRVTWDASTSAYSCSEHALSDVITDRDMANADKPLQLRKKTMENLIDKILIRQEEDAATLLFTTTTWGGNATLNTATSWVRNTTTSAPIQNMLSATTRILQRSGRPANKAVMGVDVLNALKENQNVHERIKYTQRSIVTKELLASMFDIDMIHAGTAMVNSMKEGQTQSNTSIWGTDCVVGHFKPNPGLRDVTAATTFRVMQYGNPYRVKTWREEDIEGDTIEVQTLYDMKAVATNAAYIFKTVTIV